MAVECSVQPFLGGGISFLVEAGFFSGKMLPSLNITRVVQGFVLVCLHGCVHCERVQSVHGCVVYRADDPGWADDVPYCVIGLAVLPQDFFSARLR